MSENDRRGPRRPAAAGHRASVDGAAPRSGRALIAVSVVLLASACTVEPVLPPTTADHPANPEAAAAPDLSRISALEAEPSATSLENEDAPGSAPHTGHEHEMDHGAAADEGHTMEHEHSMDSMD